MLASLISKSIPLKVAALALLGYAAFCLFLFIVQRRLIYLPSSSNSLLPDGFQAWTSPGGGKEIWGYKRVSGRTECLFFFHGNSGNASGWSHAVADFPGDIFVLEYPGYGSRPGQPSEASIKAAARAGFEAEHQRYAKIIVAGQSLGSAVTEEIFSAWPEKIHRLVLITPFLSLSEMARHQFFFAPTRWLLRDKMELYDPWRKFPGRTRIVIAGADEIIPRSHGLQYLGSTNAQVSAVEFPAAPHNGLDLDRQFWTEVLE